MGCFISVYSNYKIKRSTDNVNLFCLNGKEFIGKIVDVYDGDTCNVVIFFNGKLTKFKIRCYGYDSPELKPLKNIKNRDEIVKKSKLSRNYFISRVTNVSISLTQLYSTNEIKEIIKNNTKLVKIKCYNWDKYGRLLAEIYVNNININSEMINNNYAIKYNGGSKPIHINT